MGSWTRSGPSSRNVDLALGWIAVALTACARYTLVRPDLQIGGPGSASTVKTVATVAVLLVLACFMVQRVVRRSRPVVSAMLVALGLVACSQIAGGVWTAVHGAVGTAILLAAALVVTVAFTHRIATAESRDPLPAPSSVP